MGPRRFVRIWQYEAGAHVPISATTATPKRMRKRY